jgi:DNA repair protein RecN (Recombination protein N)
MLTQKNLIKGQFLSDNLDQNSQEKFSKIIDVLDDISLKGDKVSDLMGNILLNLNEESETLEEVEERLFAINNLCRKFNKKPTELIEFLQQSQEKLNLILKFGTISTDLKEKQKILKQEYLNFAKKLSNSRKEAALKLSKKVEDELNYLKMPGVKFLSEVKNVNEENYSANGIDKIKFLAAINQNQNFDDISKVASGGELSRFMLALKVALLGVRSVPVLIFDEIDSGIGGAVANAVGERLKLLSRKLQVMVVTHHAQVAAKSDYHLKVAKMNIGEKTNTVIEILDNDNKQIEIARMLSGENISDEALQVAKKLMFS